MFLLLTISFILFLVTLAVNIFTHYRLWLRVGQGVRVNHKKAAIYRSIGFILAGICLVFSWQILLTGLFFYLSFYWLAFDGIYNKLRKYPFWSIGSIEKDEAGTDNFLRTLTLKQHKILKIGLLLTSTILYLVTVNLQ